MRNLALIIIVLFFQWLNAQTIVWSDDFNSGGGNWTLNLNGASVIPGSTPTDAAGNSWVIDNNFNDLSGFFTNIPPSPNGGNYLHITCVDNLCSALGVTGCVFNTSNMTNKVARLTNPISGAILSGGPYLLEFEWIGNGAPGSAYATLIFSINGGPWQEHSTEYSGQTSWQNESINLTTLGWNPGESFSFGFRWRNESSGSDPAFGVDNIRIVQTGSGPSNSITTNAITPTTYCAGSNISVNFTSTGTFNAGNVYTLQMSDASGNFTTPVSIGTLSSVANSGTINGVIPINTPAGNGYRFRVISSNPSVNGSNNGQDITIQAAIQPNVTITASSNTACVGQNINFNSTVTGADNATITYQWFINGIPLGGNTPTFTTNTLQTGSTVKVVITAVGNCNTVIDTSNIIVMQGITVSCSTNTNTVFINTSGGNPPYTFRVMDFGDGTSDSLTNVSNNNASFTHSYSSTGTFNVQVSVTDANGCTAISNCTLNNTTTSLSNLVVDWPFVIYPNPFNEQLNIQIKNNFTDEINVKIVDMIGKTILNKDYNEATNGQLIIDTNSLRKGVYVIQISVNQKVYSSKIVK